MIKGTLVVRDRSLLQNKIFSSNPKIIRDEQNACFIELKKCLLKNQVDLCTEDINPVKKSRVVIVLDIDSKVYRTNNKQLIYGVLQEPPGINDYNWNPSYYAQYNKMLTWDDNLIDNKKIFKLSFGYNIKSPDKSVKWEDRDFCTSIIGCKLDNHPLDLYVRRIELSRWFSRNHPDKYKFYGQGWDRIFKFTNILKITKNSIKMLDLYRKFHGLKSAYGGEVFSKHDTLSKYKFSVCFENRRNLSGFITEKIFDCFSAGTIPIYWGADNIEKYIPSNCFIDMRKYRSYPELFKYLSAMSEKSWNNYIKNITTFIKGSKSRIFKANFYGDTITRIIMKDLRKDQ